MRGVETKLKVFMGIVLIPLLGSTLTITLYFQLSRVSSIIYYPSFESSEPPLIEWNKIYTGTSYDFAHSVVQTSDGGYAIAGYGFANLVKVDASGNLLWNKTYGGIAFSVVETTDGGFALAGYKYSFDVHRDFWLVKTNAAGDMVWNKTYGGTDYEQALSIQQTSDGGYIMTGWTESFGAGRTDFWLVKTDGVGNLLWNKTYGGTGNDMACSVVQTSDGGYAIAGYGFTNLVKTDASGNLLWHKIYGGDAFSVVETTDGGFALAGGKGKDGDGWLVKTDVSGNMMWSKTYGGTNTDTVHSIQQTVDGGYIMAGFTYSFSTGPSDFWLVKTNASGNMEWSKTCGGPGDDRANSVQQTSDGGYIMTGTWDNGNGFLLVKVASEDSINKLNLLAPWIILATSIAVAAVSITFLRKKWSMKDFT